MVISMVISRFLPRFLQQFLRIGTSSIGILDATNTTMLRRQRVLETCFAAAQEADHDDKVRSG